MLRLHNPSNMFYLSGYAERGVWHCRSDAEMQAIITDFRHTEQAEKQAPGFLGGDDRKGVSQRSDRGRLCAQGRSAPLSLIMRTITRRPPCRVLPQGRLPGRWNGRACMKKCSTSARSRTRTS
ncbi:MAG: aminopeptidase P family N-terminal domain-containing protein [Lachnospiraceae bacterium]